MIILNKLDALAAELAKAQAELARVSVIRKCVICAMPLDSNSPHYEVMRYCSPECKKEALSRKYLENNPVGKTLSATVVSKISKLRVEADLLLRGYEIYEPVNPVAPFDLLLVNHL